MKKRGSKSRKKAPDAGYSVFLSHATHDKWIATILCEKLEAAGAAVFRDDRDIEGGESIPDRIREQIEACDELVVLLTPESVTRQWVLIEIGMAIMARCRVVPLNYHLDPERFPDIIRDKRGFHLNELQQYLDELAERVTAR